MASRRILDFAAVVNASRSVARKHVALRSTQLDLYARTSSLTKGAAATEKNIDQDDGRRPTPTRARELQREAENQIPSAAAEGRGHDESSRHEQQSTDQDVFYDRRQPVSDVLSALPRVKIPKRTEDTQGSDGRVDDQAINADVYYSPADEHKIRDQAPNALEGINTDVFHSPRVAKMLDSDNVRGQREIELDPTQNPPVKPGRVADGKDEDSSNAISSESVSPQAPVDQDVRDLAAGISSDAESVREVRGSITLWCPILMY